MTDVVFSPSFSLQQVKMMHDQSLVNYLKHPDKIHLNPPLISPVRQVVVLLSLIVLLILMLLIQVMHPYHPLVPPHQTPPSPPQHTDIDIHVVAMSLPMEEGNISLLLAPLLLKLQTKYSIIHHLQQPETTVLTHVQLQMNSTDRDYWRK